jgi:NAD(P)-dependent dehydrogenase (short-subunit alcohol dehydrogenase family)
LQLPASSNKPSVRKKQQQRLSDPEDIAATVLFLCLPASRQITGQTLHVSAGAVV